MTKTFYQPLGGNEMPRFAGPATMMRLPTCPNAEDLDVCFVGVPFDIGTSNRSGTRFGPRQIRAESAMIRPYNMATGAAPFDSLTVADVGDVPINTFNLQKSMTIIETAYAEDFEWPMKMGFQVVQVEECWNRSLTPLMAEMRSRMGNAPVYVSFDIDGLDPAFAPGTGTPEIGGLTVIQGIEVLRGCRGINVVGGDLVEVSPPYDTSGNTALVAANRLYELLCSLPGVKYSK